MKLTPHSQKLADDWFDQDGDPRELTEILGIARGGIDFELKGHCYREVRDEDFSPRPIEDFIDDEERVRQLAAGEVAPSDAELEAWRDTQRESQPATEFYVWKVPFSVGSRFICTIHRKNGFVDRVDGPFHSADASIPYGEIVFD